MLPAVVGEATKASSLATVGDHHGAAGYMVLPAVVGEATKGSSPATATLGDHDGATGYTL